MIKSDLHDMRQCWIRDTISWIVSESYKDDFRNFMKTANIHIKIRN